MCVHPIGVRDLTQRRVAQLNVAGTRVSAGARDKVPSTTRFPRLLKCGDRAPTVSDTGAGRTAGNSVVPVARVIPVAVSVGPGRNATQMRALDKSHDASEESAPKKAHREPGRLDVTPLCDRHTGTVLPYFLEWCRSERRIPDGSSPHVCWENRELT